MSYSLIRCKENKISMSDLDVQTLTSTFVDGFNRNFFDRDRCFI